MIKTVNEILLIIAAIAFGIGGVYLIGKLWPTRVTVSEWQWSVPITNGRAGAPLRTGAHWIFPWRTELREFDRRPLLEVVPGQEVLTKDNVGLKLSLVVEAVIADPVALLKGTEYERHHVYHATQLALREVVSGRTLDELLDDRAAIGPDTQALIVAPLAEMGVEIKTVRVRDIMLSKELRDSYAGVLTAKKQGEIALERARAESAALRNLANAARMLKDNPDLLQLRIVQAMTAPESAKNTFVVGTNPPVPPVPDTDGSPN